MMIPLVIVLFALHARALYVPEDDQVVWGVNAAHGALRRFTALPQYGWDVESIVSRAQVSIVCTCPSI